MKRRSFITHALAGLASLPLLSRLSASQTALPIKPDVAVQAFASYSYAGNGTDKRTIVHGLGFQPTLVIRKRNHAFDVQATAR